MNGSIHSYIQNENYMQKLLRYFFSLSTEAHCVDEKFGKGNEGFKAAVPCEPNQVGEITAVCKENRQFGDIEENCILLPVQKLLDESEVTSS